MDIEVAKTLYTSIDAGLAQLLSTRVPKVMAGLAGVIGTFWTLSLVIRSLQWLWMGMTQIFRDVVFELLKMAFITAMAFNVASYVANVVPFVTGFPPWMGGLLSGQEGSQVTQVDTLINVYVEQLKQMIAAMSFNPFTTKLSDMWLSIQGAVLYLVGGIPFLLVAVGTTLTLKVATTVILAVGPLFIALSLFDQTRQYFWGWVAVVAGFMLTHVLFAVVLALEIAYINSNLITNGQINTSLMGNISMLIVFCTFTVLATELPGYAATIMGGAATGATGMGGIMSKAMGAQTALRMSKGAGKAGNALLNRFRNRIG